jgi:hypothetical protein
MSRFSLNVCHTVTLPESAISSQKESNSLQKRAGGSNALKWGLAEMVLWSVRGWYRFSVFFAVQFCKCRKKMVGNLPTGPPILEQLHATLTIRAIITGGITM